MVQRERGLDWHVQPFDLFRDPRVAQTRCGGPCACPLA